MQDGRPQPVTAVAYVRADERLLDETGTPLASRPTSPKDARRVIAVIVDDSRMSFESIARTRTVLRRFVDEQLMPDDLVCLITTSGGIGSKWDFTYGRAELKAAAARLRFSLWNATTRSAMDPIDGSMLGGQSEIDATLERTFAINALNRIFDVINAVHELPGRKTIVLVSEGFAMFGPGDYHSLIRDAMQRLVDRANRAGVVVYAVDPRGLVFTGLSAADNPNSMRAALDAMALRNAALRETQDGLRFVAGETGGFAVVNNNDLRAALGRVMADQSGYYLIGYQPPQDTFARTARPDFHQLKIKVTRKGLSVRTRAGFYPFRTE
jgi:VWFA-related protein